MSPRNSKQIGEIRQKSKAKIVTAAIQLFSKKGYQQVSVSEIAKSANVAKGLIYNYFESKEKILQEITENIFGEMIEYMSVMEKESEPLKRMELLVRSSIQLFKEKKDYYRLIMPLLLQPSFSEKLHKKMSSFIKVLIQDIELSLEKMGIENAKMEALKIGAMIDGIALHYLFVYREGYPIDEMQIYLTKHIKNLKK